MNIICPYVHAYVLLVFVVGGGGGGGGGYITAFRISHEMLKSGPWFKYKGVILPV